MRDPLGRERQRGFNSSNPLNATATSADGDVDMLFGDGSLDWFWADDEKDLNNIGVEIVTGTSWTFDSMARR